MNKNRGLDSILELQSDIAKHMIDKGINPQRDDIWEEVVEELEITLDDKQKKLLDKICFLFSLSMACEMSCTIQNTLTYLYKNGLLK